MIQYMLNATAIWLVSLLLFDLFLRKQTYHSYNRMFLIISFFSGLLLPLWQWQENIVINDEYAGTTPTTTIALVKHSIAEAQSVRQTLDVESWLLMLYAAGVCVSILILFKELIVLTHYYRQGNKTKLGQYTVVETGKEHGPFSLFHTIFISSKANYNQEQLRILLAHEQQHGRFLHSIDLLIFQLFKAAFWFHPLAYIYTNRLTMVHEYQSDSAIDITPDIYGSFLLEQAMLHSTPSITHSFNRSPLKNRIMMLTRPASHSKIKWLLPLPMIAIFVLCFTKNSFSDDKKQIDGNKLTYRGNVFEMSPTLPPDTVMVENPVTKEIEMRVVKVNPRPIKINGKPIYDPSDVQTPVTPLSTTFNELRSELAEKLANTMSNLKDGKYSLSLPTLYIDEKGKLVYFDDIYISRPDNLWKDEETNKQIKMTVEKITDILYDFYSLRPASLNGKSVASYITGPITGPYVFEIKNHQVRLVQ